MRRTEATTTRLDLVPIMNLVTILIPFLLLSASFVSVAVVDATQPAVTREPGPPQPDPPPSPPTLVIDAMGFLLAPPAGAGEPTRVPCLAAGCGGAEAYDVVALRDAAAALKARAPDEERIILTPTGAVPYEVLIAAMDATRGGEDDALFPLATIAAGI